VALARPHPPRPRRVRALDVLLIEHDMGLVMDICEAITVLDHGVVDRGRARRTRSRPIPKVIEAYLGAPATAGASEP
jgi:ABC-type branched-subunit amino acid transport system ATPase component